MVIVDVYVPAVEQTYDFSLDETCKIGALIEEMQEMIASKEHREIVDAAELELCNLGTKARLNKNSTLEENGILTGAKLILL